MKNKESLNYHSFKKGKIGTLLKTKLENKKDLSLAYTPGVADVCKEIYKEKEKVFEYTSKGNTVAIVSDGTAVLGLGSIGPEAAIPVMEGKAVLFKKFADIDAVPLCIPSHLSAQEIVTLIKNISPSFAGINLEDVAAPKCFEITKLMKDSGIIFFHDDQYGTAVVVLAALINSLKIINKDISEIKVVINGAGAAGMAISDILVRSGLKNLILCDRDGIVDENNYKIEKRKEYLKYNIENIKGNLDNAIKDAHVFIGVSGPDVLKERHIRTMNKNSIIFALANPDPEIQPEKAYEYGAFIVATGRSDYSNQVNNVLGFPGIFRGAIDSRVDHINIEMCIVAAKGLANTLKDSEINKDKILPDVFDERVVKNVASSIVKYSHNKGLANCGSEILKKYNI